LLFSHWYGQFKRESNQLLIPRIQLPVTPILQEKPHHFGSPEESRRGCLERGKILRPRTKVFPAKPTAAFVRVYKEKTGQVALHEQYVSPKIVAMHETMLVKPPARAAARATAW
jgi:hypothetical protein